MQTSTTGRRLLMEREGAKLRAYRDVRGIWTIGVGHTSAAGPPRVWPWTTLTMEQVGALLTVDLAKYELAVSDAVKRQLTQNQFDACVSLCYNIGPGGFSGSSVVKQINLGNMQAAADDFLMWEKPAALAARRQSERKQFLS